jgi:alkyl hydroperoxide reductase subunit F
VTSVKSKQIIIAAGDGAKAALEAYEYVMNLA